MFEICDQQWRPLTVADRGDLVVLRLQRGAVITDDLVDELNQLVGDACDGDPPPVADVAQWFASVVDSCCPSASGIELPSQRDVRAYARSALRKAYAQAPHQHGVMVGVLAAAALLIPLTLIFALLDTKLSMVSQMLCYLIVVGVSGAIGGMHAAGLVAPAASLLADYFVVPPLHSLSPDHVALLAAMVTVSALVTVARRKSPMRIPRLALAAIPPRGQELQEAVTAKLAEVWAKHG